MANFDYVKLADYCAGTTDLSAAINSALSIGLGPEGGTIDATNVDSSLMKFKTTVDVHKPLTLLLGAGTYTVEMEAPSGISVKERRPLFNIAPPELARPMSFRITGLDPTATTILAAKSGTTLFELSGDFFRRSDWSPYFCVQRVKLDGNPLSSSSIMLSTIGGAGSPKPPVLQRGGGLVPPLHFENGLLVVEDCTITNFGGASAGAAIQIAPSVYFSRFHRNEFINNYQAIYLDNNTEASITENMFVQGPRGGASLTLVGPMHRVVHNYFYRNRLADTSNEPDILLLPQKEWNRQAGGYVWIEDNRFGSEHENLDPGRTRIKLFSQADASLVGGPVIVRGNQFNGASARIAKLTGDGAFATVTFFDAKTPALYNTTQGLSPGTIITIHGAGDASHGGDPSFNGTFAVQRVVDDASFTYALAHEGSASGGTVSLASSDSLGFPPMSITSASSSGTVVTVTVASTASLTTGKVVTINGSGDALYNGTHPVTVISSTQFTYTLPSAHDRSPGIGGGVVYATNGGAITLMNPHLAWDVSGNDFLGCQTLMLDYQAQDAVEGYGQSIFADNRVYSRSLQPGYQVFANEGRNFTVVRLPPDASPPANTTLGALDLVVRRNETRSLRNRIAQSEALQFWRPTNGIEVSKAAATTSMDPFGSERAFTLALGPKKGKRVTSQHISQEIDMSGLGVGARLVIKFWAKRGTLSTLRVGVFHANGQQWHGNLFTANLGSDWRQYKFVTNGVVSVADVLTLAFYPGDSAQTTGDVLLFGPQVSDDDTDYYPTGASSAHDDSAGNRFEQAAVITSLKTMTHSGAALPEPKATWGGSSESKSTGTAGLGSGSSDFAGVINIQVSTGLPTTGTVTVTYAKPYVGANPPVVVACLVDGDTAAESAGVWGSASVRVVPAESSNGHFTLRWFDSSGLMRGRPYGISYIVIGRT